MSDRIVRHHLGWCVQENCTEHVHRGRLAVIEPVAESTADPNTWHNTITVQLVQHVSQPTPEMEIGTYGADSPVRLDLEQARELAFVVRREWHRAYSQMIAAARRGES